MSTSRTARLKQLQRVWSDVELQSMHESSGPAFPPPPPANVRPPPAANVAPPPPPPANVAPQPYGYVQMLPPPKEGNKFGIVTAATVSVIVIFAAANAVANPSALPPPPATAEASPSTLPFSDEEADSTVTTDSDFSSSDMGSRENPLPFGQPHSREPGISGAGWTVSIDDVREVPHSLLSDSSDSRICLGVIVSAKLDSLDGDDLVSSPLSLPDINLIDVDGRKAESGFLECDTSRLAADGVVDKLAVKLVVGGTATYVDPVLIESSDYSFVAVESTVYTASASAFADLVEPTESAETKLPDGLIYTVTETDNIPEIKRSMTVELNQKLTGAQLELLASELKELDSSTYERTFIGYFAPSTPDHEEGYWASTHFNPDLDV